MSDELKPCKRCGGKAMLVINDSEHEYDWDWFVQCKACYERTDTYSSIDKAIAAWNTRDNDNMTAESVVSDKHMDANDVIMAQADSREKLEEDAFEFASYLLYANYDGVDDIPVNAEEKREMRELLDRQAAITERELCAKCEWPSLATMPDVANTRAETNGITSRTNGITRETSVIGQTVESDEADSRERLEADVRGAVHGAYAYEDYIPEDMIFDWLDRQAVITERELCEYFHILDRTDELEEQVDSLTAELCGERKSREYAYNELNKMLALDGKRVKQINELTAERDELRDIIAHMPKTEQECEACQDAHDRLMFNSGVEIGKLRDELKHKQLVIDRQRDSFLKLETENAKLRKELDGCSR